MHFFALDDLNIDSPFSFTYSTRAHLQQNDSYNRSGEVSAGWGGYLCYVSDEVSSGGKWCCHFVVHIHTLSCFMEVADHVPLEWEISIESISRRSEYASRGGYAPGAECSVEVPQNPCQTMSGERRYGAKGTRVGIHLPCMRRRMTWYEWWSFDVLDWPR